MMIEEMNKILRHKRRFTKDGR